MQDYCAKWAILRDITAGLPPSEADDADSRYEAPWASNRWGRGDGLARWHAERPPKGTFAVIDDRTLAFADIRSPQTVRNLKTDPRVEVNFVDPFVRKGYRFAGTARLVQRGEAGFDALLDRIRSSFAPRVRTVVVIAVDKAAPSPRRPTTTAAPKPSCASRGRRGSASCSRAGSSRNSRPSNLTLRSVRRARLERGWQKASVRVPIRRDASAPRGSSG